MTMTTALQILETIWVDALLSGDNAVVIALAVRGLSPNLQHAGIIIGVLVAILLRLVGLFLAAILMAIPGLRAAGGALLIYIVYKLVFVGSGGSNPDHTTRSTLLGAIAAIGAADAAMSLDNVIAIAAIAKGDFMIMALGITASIPMVVFGSTIITRFFDQAPWLVYAAGLLLFGVAIDIAIHDPFVESYVPVILSGAEAR